MGANRTQGGKDDPHEYAHYHECPSCKRKYGCDKGGCGGSDWSFKVCLGCYDEFFRKLDQGDKK